MRVWSYVKLAILLIWNLDNLPSYESYKIVTSKALGTMHGAQHFFIAGKFGNDRSKTIVVLISGALVRAD